MPELYLFVVIICGLEMDGTVTCVRGIDKDPPTSLILCAERLRKKSLGILDVLQNSSIVQYNAWCQKVKLPGNMVDNTEA